MSDYEFKAVHTSIGYLDSEALEKIDPLLVQLAQDADQGDFSKISGRDITPKNGYTTMLEFEYYMKSEFVRKEASSFDRSISACFRNPQQHNQSVAERCANSAESDVKAFAQQIRAYGKLLAYIEKESKPKKAK